MAGSSIWMTLHPAAASFRNSLFSSSAMSQTSARWSWYTFPSTRTKSASVCAEIVPNFTRPISLVLRHFPDPVEIHRLLSEDLLCRQWPHPRVREDFVEQGSARILIQLLGRRQVLVRRQAADPIERIVQPRPSRRLGIEVVIAVGQDIQPGALLIADRPPRSRPGTAHGTRCRSCSARSVRHWCYCGTRTGAATIRSPLWAASCPA